MSTNTSISTDYNVELVERAQAGHFRTARPGFGGYSVRISGVDTWAEEKDFASHNERALWLLGRGLGSVPGDIILRKHVLGWSRDPQDKRDVYQLDRCDTHPQVVLVPALPGEPDLQCPACIQEHDAWMSGRA